MDAERRVVLKRRLVNAKSERDLAAGNLKQPTLTNSQLYDFLVGTYSEQELRRFCKYDEKFKPVSLQFSSSASASEIAEKLIDFADKKGLKHKLFDGLFWS
jgi:hypothetical protein